MLGPPVRLDPIQQRYFADYRRLRARAGPDCGIEIPPGTDPLIARHYEAMDAAFFDDRNRYLRQEQDRVQKEQEQTRWRATGRQQQPTEHRPKAS